MSGVAPEETDAGSIERRPNEPGAARPRASLGVMAIRVLIGAAALAIAELSAVLNTRVGSLFLGFDEREEYFVALAGLAPVLVMFVFAVGWALSRIPSPTRAQLLGALAAGGAGALLVSLSAGRRVHDHALRWPIVIVVAVLVGFAVLRAEPRLERRLGRSGWLAASGLLLAVAACFADILILPRLYPPFHLALRLIGLLGASAVGAFLPLPAVVSRPVGGALAVALVAVAACVGPWRAWVLAEAPNLSFVLGEHVPVTGRPVALLTRIRAAEAAPAAVGEGAVDVSPTGSGGFTLDDRNVLLITVDALRADRLRAYGGSGLTPEMDALAGESVVFERAYTPTPHTSYALTSLLCGKYLRPVLELPGAQREHPALPELLRRYGHRTAAFYPPAIFFVDAHRFEALRETHFGFEYRKEEFASGAERVDQLRDYLELSDAAHPVFAWVHLFEPHEPYDPPEAYRRGDSAAERYDGEVAAADAAIGELIRVFRASRPGATVILSADHGEEFGDHGGHYHGSTLYDEQVRVPLLWSTPGLTPGRRVGAPVELIDLSTTLLAALGIPRDARMRGDDLGGLLTGAAEAEQTGVPRYAFAGILDERMVVDGRFKAICRGAGASCRLYDLEEDPAESRNIAGEQRERLRTLQAALASFVGSIPRVEGMTMGSADVGWPEALARAQLGDPGAARDVAPLLADARAPVRAAAASALGALTHLPSLPALLVLAESDEDPTVRREAALAALALHHVSTSRRSGAASGQTPTAELPESLGPALREARSLVMPNTPAGATEAQRQRAALALAHLGDASGAGLLRALVSDSEQDEEARRAGVAALASLGDRASLGALAALLPDPRLSVSAADALAELGDPRAAGPLLRALAEERYLPAREAQVRALSVLGERRAVPLIWRFMGVDRPVHTGLEALERLGALRRFGARGGLLSAASTRVLTGEWQCGSSGCTPGEGASIRLTGPGAVAGEARVIVVVKLGTPPNDSGAPERHLPRHEPGGSEADMDIDIEIDGRRYPLRGPETWLTFLDEGPAVYAFAPNDRITVRALFRVPATGELPAPQAEPWDAGVQAPASAASPGGE